MPRDRRSAPSRTTSNGRPKAGACALRLVFSAAKDGVPVGSSPSAEIAGNPLSMLAWRLCEAQMQLCFALWALPRPIALRPAPAAASAGPGPKAVPYLRRVK
jgi:hypothetical protein